MELSPGPPEFFSHDSGSGYRVTLSPPGASKDGNKSLLELLIAPIAVVLVTGIVGYVADRINHRAQEAANERTIQAAQIAAVAAISAGPTKPHGAEDESGQQGIPLFVARLVLYEEHAVPILLALLQDEESSQQLNPQERTVVERNLIQIALRGHADAVGRPMLEVLNDPWNLYGYRTHRSALRILSRICYSGFDETIAKYRPEKTMKEGDWDNLNAHSEELESFQNALHAAKAHVKDSLCGMKSRD